MITPFLLTLVLLVGVGLFSYTLYRRFILLQAALTGSADWDLYLRYVEAHIKAAERMVELKRDQAAALVLLDEDKAKAAAAGTQQGARGAPRWCCSMRTRPSPPRRSPPPTSPASRRCAS